MLLLCLVLFPNLSISEARVFQVVKDSATLEVRVSLSKESYLLYEPIICEVWIKNITCKSTEAFYVSWSGWIIEDESGKHYRPVPMINHFKPRRLNPGDSLGGRFKPLERLDEGIFVSKDAVPRNVLPKGRYRFRYKAYGDSTFLKFQVEEPTGDEAAALKMYLEARGVVGEYTTSPAPSDSEVSRLQRSAVEKLVRLADTYPKSVYAISALRLAEGSAWNVLSDSKLYSQIRLRLLREYPEVGMEYLYNLGLLKSFYSTYPIRDQRVQSLIAQLTEIIKESKDETVRDRAKKMLEEINAKIIPDTTEMGSK